jgi:hypothetical protein
MAVTVWRRHLSDLAQQDQQLDSKSESKVNFFVTYGCSTTTATPDGDSTQAQVTAANLGNASLMFGLGGPPKARGRPKLIGDELGR